MTGLRPRPRAAGGRFCNLSLRAKEWNGDLVFLHEAVPGPADRSYGVQVAKLAGVPPVTGLPSFTRTGVVVSKLTIE